MVKLSVWLLMNSERHNFQIADFSKYSSVECREMAFIYKIVYGLMVTNLNYIWQYIFTRAKMIILFVLMEAKRYILLGKMRPSIHADVNLTVSQDHPTPHPPANGNGIPWRQWPASTGDSAPPHCKNCWGSAGETQQEPKALTWPSNFRFQSN